jgi:hypothetical protein
MAPKKPDPGKDRPIVDSEFYNTFENCYASQLFGLAKDF